MQKFWPKKVFYINLHFCFLLISNIFEIYLVQFKFSRHNYSFNDHSKGKSQNRRQHPDKKISDCSYVLESAK